MKTLRDESARAEIAERVGRLTPDTRARWGKMDSTRMLAHVNDALRMATGELPVPFKKTPLRFRIVRTALIYWLPFPKGAPTAPQLINRSPGELAREADELRQRLAAFPDDVPGGWPVHPVFGQLSATEWGALGYKHLDHHLRQFGV
jgi:hypothetical protein